MFSPPRKKGEAGLPGGTPVAWFLLILLVLANVLMVMYGSKLGEMSAILHEVKEHGGALVGHAQEQKASQATHNDLGDVKVELAKITAEKDAALRTIDDLHKELGRLHEREAKISAKADLLAKRTQKDQWCHFMDQCERRVGVEIDLAAILPKEITWDPECWGKMKPADVEALREEGRREVARIIGKQPEDLARGVRLDKVGMMDEWTLVRIKHALDNLLPGRRQVPWTVAVEHEDFDHIVDYAAGLECLNMGLQTPDIKARMFNETWASFNTHSMDLDALLFAMDVFLDSQKATLRGHWLNAQLATSPFDALYISDLIATVKPDLVVEVGTGAGGSALLWATTLDFVNPEGRVITIDTTPPESSYGLWVEGAFRGKPQKQKLWKRRIELISGSAEDDGVVQQVRRAASEVDGAVMVVLDGVPSHPFMAKMLESYAPLVTNGSYVVASNTRADRLLREGLPGPAKAVDQFLETRLGQDFSRDRHVEAMIFTQNPGGYLLRVHPPQGGLSSSGGGRGGTGGGLGGGIRGGGSSSSRGRGRDEDDE